MKELLPWSAGFLCALGVLATLLVACFPAWFLVRYSEGKKWLRFFFKTLFLFGAGGWYFPGMWMSERLHLNEGVAGFSWLVSMGLICLCVTRGEEISRRKGEIEDDGRGGVRYVKRR